MLIAVFALAGLQTDTSTSKGLYLAFRSFSDSFFVILLAFHLSRQAKLEEILKGIKIFLTFFFILGILEYLLKQNLIYKWICESFPIYNGIFDLNGIILSTEGWRPRVFITTIHANTLGCLLSLLFWLYFPKIFKTHDAERKNCLLYLGIILLLTVFTGSLTALVSIAASVAIFLMRKLIPSLQLLVLAFAIFTSGYALNIAVNNLMYREGSSLDMRQNQILYTLLLIKDNPLRGHGFNYINDVVFEKDAYGDRIDTSLGSEIGALESILFSWWIERGLIFLIVFFAYMIALMFYFRKHRRQNMAVEGEYLVLTLSFFLILSGEMGGNTFMGSCLIGLCLGTVFKEQEIDSKELDDESHEESEKAAIL